MNALTTKEAMKVLKVFSYEGFNKIREAYGIKPAWRGGEGNVYLRKDIDNINNTMDKVEDPFYDSVNG